MSDRLTLERLCTCEDDWVVQKTATIVSDIANAVDTGDMSKDEALEILEDMQRTDLVFKKSEMTQLKTDLIEATKAVVGIIKAIT